MNLNSFANDLISKFPLGFVATVTAEGRPHLSPKGTFLVLAGDVIAFGEIRSPGTLANLEHNPETEVNFIDQWKRKGIRVRGKSRVLARDTDEFGTLIGKWHAIWGELADRINALVLIKVDQVRVVTTPPYDDGVSEEDMIALYKQKFAEIYP